MSKFLVLEGLDGSGKSTQVSLLKRYFELHSISYKYLHFPRTDRPFFGELVAMYLRGDLGSLNEVHPRLVAMLYAGDRFDAASEINEWLNQGFVVLADRYMHSNIAYQCAKVADPDERARLATWIRSLEYAYFHIPKPDLTVFLDVPFQFVTHNLNTQRTGADRRYLEGNRDIHEEDLSFQSRVREVYLLQAAEESRFTILDCSLDATTVLPPEAIFDKLIAVLAKNQVLINHKSSSR